MAFISAIWSVELYIGANLLLVSLPGEKTDTKAVFKIEAYPTGGGAGKGGTATLFVNGKKAGEGRIEKTIPARYSMDTFDVGMDLNAAVGNDYKTPFKFTGKINKVTIDLKGK